MTYIDQCSDAKLLAHEHYDWSRVGRTIQAEPIRLFVQNQYRD